MKYKNISIWNDIKQESICPKLDKDLDVDVIIVGGGLTGISTAYHLINSNLKVCLVERNEIGRGVTSRSTAKITYLQENFYSKIKMYYNKDKAKQYLNSQIYAMNLVKNIVEKEKIDCDLEKVKSYVYSKSKKNTLKKEMNLLKEFKINVNECSTLPNNEKVENAFYVDDTYVFHPLKYLYSLKNICLKNNIEIYENTKVVSIEKKGSYYFCKTDNNKIKAKYVVMASHYPFFLIPFWMPLKASIERSYIKAYSVKKDYRFSAINISKPIISVRYYSNNDKIYQIYLTNSHNYEFKSNDKKHFQELIKSKRKDPEYIWSNKDIITNDYLPFIGSITKDETFLIGTGYNTWGMTNGSLAGEILTDIILKKENKYIELFDPKRCLNIGKIINFPIILLGNIYSFLKTKIIKNKKSYPKNVKFETRNGKNIAIYIDENQKEHIVYNLCPHLKCSLIFNEVEKTWDCPCHGSRFDIDGNCIEGPSNYDIKYKE